MNYLMILIKGLIVGGTMLVPGVSGGSMAMILGVYNRLIFAISNFFKDIKGNTKVLLAFVAGGGVGILLFAKPLLALIETYPMPMLYFFIGAVAGGVPLMLKEARVKKFSFKIIVYIIIGFLIVILLNYLPLSGLETQSGFDLGVMIYLLIAGIIAAVALVLPGISVSYLLLMMGLYENTMRAISEFDLLFLLPLALGVILGIILTTKILDYFMTKYPEATYLIILGFILGSLLELFPGIPSGFEIILCIITMSLGFLAIYFISLKELKSKKE